MFDVPPALEEVVKWSGNVPIEDKPWNIGLIVGPSGSGKSTVSRDLFKGEVDKPLSWSDQSVIEDFRSDISMQDIAGVCGAVGFNTIPAWRRPFSVLSTGEQFRVELARRLIEGDELVVVDEFTSVVDRQVAKIGSHAVQKYIRRAKRKFVAVTCHHDVVDWLQPDWILELPSLKFSWHRRSLRRDGTTQRPELKVTVSPIAYSAWNTFAPYHYLTNKLHKAARCYGLFVGDRLAAFSGILHFAHPKVKNIKRCSRLVTLPDWQGLGLAFVLNEVLASAYKTQEMRFRCYPAHPALIRSFDKSIKWSMTKKPGVFQKNTKSGQKRFHSVGGRPCAVFEYAGKKMEDEEQARRLVVG
jgi:ABC-type uncharacterized transport system YnjBCD ATPase subunit